MIAGAVMAVPALILLGSFVAPGSRVSLTAAAAPAPPLIPTPTPTPITCLLVPTPTSLPFVPTPIPLPLCTPIPTPIPLPPPPPVPTPPPPLPTLPPLPIPSLFPGPTPTGPGTLPPPPPGSPPGLPPGAPPPPPGFPTAGGPAGGTFTGGSSTPTLPNAGGAGGQTWPQSLSGHLVVADPLLAAQINYVLANPISAQRPDLLHFSVLGSSPASFIMGGIFGSGGGPGAPPILPAAGAALLLVGLASGVFVLILRAPWRKIITGLVVVPAALAIALPATAAVLLSHPANSQATSASSRATSSAAGLRTHAASLGAPAAVSTWTTLIGIENALTAQHDQAVSDEQAISTIVATLQQPDKIGGPHSLRPTATLMLTAQMRALIAHYQVVAGAYEQSLQREYEFFKAAAQSPTQLAALQSASSRTPANVQQALSYDINLVQTQLAQEAAINGAIDQAAPVIQRLAAIVGPVTLHAPLSGVVSQGFGPTSFSMEPPVNYRGVFYPHFHTGLDIAAPRGSLVGAAAPGTELLATSSRDSNGNLVGYGNYVVIQHSSGFLTLYGHLDRLLVTQGQQVAQGQVIGLCGSTGWSTGPHVHFELRINGEFVDPAPYIAANIR